MDTIHSDNISGLFNHYQSKRFKVESLLSSRQNVSVGLDKPTSNLFRHRPKKKPAVNLKEFNDFIQLNATEGWADFEGMTTFEDCVAATLPLGFMPAVVPELKTITIGGAATGVGIESSSFKFGFVHECILEMDILCPSGKVLTCSPEENPDLFFGFPNSYGTLGYALRVRMQVIPVKKHVALSHFRFSDRKDFLREIENYCSQPDVWDFVEGVIFSEKKSVITCGRFTDEAPYASDYTYMDIYYKSLEEKKTDYLTTADYIWRWDSDWFWCSSHFLAQKPWMRRLLGKERLRSTTYWNIRSKASEWGITKILDVFGGKKEAIIQDVEVPVENAHEFLDFFHSTIGITPVWVCPTRVADPQKKYALYPMTPGKLYLNFGFWDVVKSEFDPGHYNRLLENTLIELKGMKSLYSDSYYSEADFWKLYDGTRYRALKKKYDPEGKFSDIYSKCVIN